MDPLISWIVFPLAQIGGEGLTQILVWIVIAAVVWIILRTVLRLASRVFTMGCFLLVLLGAALLLFRYFS